MGWADASAAHVRESRDWSVITELRRGEDADRRSSVLAAQLSTFWHDDGEPWCAHQAGLEARGADKMLVGVLRLISFGASIADGLDGAVDLRLTERELVL